MADSESPVLVDDPRPHVRRLTLNRPNKRNALSHRLRSELFDAPVPVRIGPLPNYVGSAESTNSPADLRTGRIEVTYNVTNRGRVRDLRTEAFPAEFTDIQRMTHREIRSRIHRPRTVDGLPVATEGMVFEHEFQYRQSELETIRKNNAAVAAANGENAEEAEEK